MLCGFLTSFVVHETCGACFNYDMFGSAARWRPGGRVMFRRVAQHEGSRRVQDTEAYKSTAAHVELAKKMMKRDSASAPTVGDRVAFVIVKAAKGSKASDKAEDPIWALENNLPIDAQHYLEHHLKLPLMRIFEPILGERQAKSLLSGAPPQAGLVLQRCLLLAPALSNVSLQPATEERECGTRLTVGGLRRRGAHADDTDGDAERVDRRAYEVRAQVAEVHELQIQAARGARDAVRALRWQGGRGLHRLPPLCAAPPERHPVALC